MSLQIGQSPSRLAASLRGHSRSRRAMVNFAGARRSSHHTPKRSALLSTLAGLALIVAMLAMVSGIFLSAGPAQAAEARPTSPPPAPGGPLTFDDSVKFALTRSPQFTKSSLDIEIRKLDETDSRYGMVPPLTFRTYYYVNRPDASGLGPPYSISFSTDPYNPVASYFMLQVQKLTTQVAIFAHLKVISKGLQGVGNFYLQLDSLNKQLSFQKDLIKVAQEHLTYTENRMNIGTGTVMEVKVAQQELQLARGELEGINLMIKRVLTNLRNVMGWPADQELNLNFQDSRRQVLGNFNPATASLEQAKVRDYDIKVFDIYKELQGYNISLAIAKVLPTILFTTQTPDPLSVTSARGLYVGVGLEIPVWDGLKRFRNVTRQKTVLKQIGAQKTGKESSVDGLWYEILSEIQERGVLLKTSQLREELARLKTHQKEVLYQSGEAPLPVLLECRREFLSIQRDTARAAVAHDIAVFKLRELSGDLGYTYVDASSWQK